MDEKRDPPPESTQPASGEQADSLSPLPNDVAEDEEATAVDSDVERDSVAAEEGQPERESVDDDGGSGSDRGNRSEESI